MNWGKKFLVLMTLRLWKTFHPLETLTFSIWHWLKSVAFHMKNLNFLYGNVDSYPNGIGAALPGKTDSKRISRTFFLGPRRKSFKERIKFVRLWMDIRLSTLMILLPCSRRVCTRIVSKRTPSVVRRLKGLHPRWETEIALISRYWAPKFKSTRKSRFFKRELRLWVEESWRGRTQNKIDTSFY